jgi:hypothetical protein
MRKLWIYLTILAALLLSACQAASATPNAAATPTKGAPAVPTADPKAAKMECQVVSVSPTQEPTLQSAFPPPTKDDWSLGNTDNPRLTILEYSDFM